MKVSMDLEFRGKEAKISKKGKKFYIINTEDVTTGEALRFLNSNEKNFKNFDELERGKVYNFNFTILNNSLYLEGVN